MIIECTACKKKFSVPDGAITANGRLVQCSSCGNKWTQYPIQAKKTAPKIPSIKKSVSNKNIVKKKKRSNTLFKRIYGTKVGIDNSELRC